MPAAAVIATVAVSAYTANKQAKAAKSAANTQARSADQASQVQWDMFNQARQDNEPWRQTGLVAQDQIRALLGLPATSASATPAGSAMSPSGAINWFDANSRVPTADPSSYASDPLYKKAWDEVTAYHNGRFDKTSDRMALGNHLQSIYDKQRAAQQTGTTPATGAASASPLTQQKAFDLFRNTPGYQFGLTEGQRALESSAAARGGLFSGKAGKELQKFGQNYADQVGYQPYMSQLFQLAGYGQTATNQNNQVGMATANNVGQNMMNAGAARASGINGSADAWGNFAGGLTGLAGIALGRNNGSWGWGGV